MNPLRSALRRWMTWSPIAVVLVAMLATGALAPPAAATELPPVAPGSTSVARATAPDQGPPDSAAHADSLAASEPGPAQVVVGGRLLFTIGERLYGLSPLERARLIEERIRLLAHQPGVRPESLRVIEWDGASEIIHRDVVLMTVTPRDAVAAGVERAELAGRYAARIREAVRALREDFSVRTLVVGAGWVLLFTAILLLALRLLRVGFGQVDRLAQRRLEGASPRLRFRNLDIVIPIRVVDGARRLLGAVRFVVTLSLLYLWVTAVLGAFPLTRPYSARMTADIVRALLGVLHAMGSYVPNLVFIVVVSIVAYYVVQLVRWFFGIVGRGEIVLPGFYPEWAQPTFQIARFLLVIFTMVVIFPYLPGSKSPAFQGISLFVGLLVSLGSSSAISNVISGTLLTYTRAFQVGDRVQIGENVGDVVAKSLLTTHLRTIKNVEIAVPNALVLGTHIVNYSAAARDRGLILNTTVSIGYDVPWRKVHGLLLGAARATPGIVADPAPFVLQTGLDDSYVRYEINATTRDASSMAGIYSDLNQAIQDAFRDAGVEILSPMYASIRDGNPSTVPPASGA